MLNGIIDGIIYGNKEVYNPVFFYGEDSAIAIVLDTVVSDFKSTYPSKKVVWKRGDNFTHEMILAIRDEKMEGFRKACRNCDLLVFDRVETIAGKCTTMKEFYELFDHVFINGGRLVIAGRITPNLMDGLDDRIKTQLEAGIIYNVS